MNMFYSEAKVFEEYKDKIDLSNLTKELLGNFNQDFYKNFIKIVVSDLSLNYKQQFIEDWFAAVLIGNKKYGDNLEWLMDLFKGDGLLDISNDGKLFSILIDRDSNIFSSYNDFMTMMKYFPKMDNFKDFAFILAEDPKIEEFVLDSINTVSELKFFRYNLEGKAQAHLYIYADFLTHSKEEKLNNKEKVLKANAEKEKIESHLEKSVLLPDENNRKRI